MANSSTWVTGQPWPMCPQCGHSMSRSLTMDTIKDSCPWCDDPRTARLREEVERLKDDRAAVLRECLDAIPEGICTCSPECEDPTCPKLLVNVAISALLAKSTD